MSHRRKMRAARQHDKGQTHTKRKTETNKTYDMKRLFLILCIAFGAMTAASAGSKAKGVERPKLVVGIVVDQMRWDYLTYYSRDFGSDGFQRLQRNGYECTNVQLNYTPTVTAVGHACVYTGSVPALTGIPGNNFYRGGRKMYCCDDRETKAVGVESSRASSSPRNMRVTTMSDEIKTAQDFRSKTISVSLKDRAAILPGGHTANAAYWFSDKTGGFVTSTYYMQELPEWVQAHNKANKAEGDVWNTPLGNEVVGNMAIAALKNERLGQGETMDFLAVSFSTPDAVGHKYSTRSEQMDEVYHKLDKVLARLLTALDEQVGKNGYLIFLTADHAAVHNAVQMNKNNIPAGEWLVRGRKDMLNAELSKLYGNDIKFVKDVIEFRVYLDHEAIATAGKRLCEVKDDVCAILMKDKEVAYAVAYDKAATASIPAYIRERIVNGYDPKLSGDIQVVLMPGYYDGYSQTPGKGSTHGTPWPYDNHIPLIFCGWNVPKGSSAAPQTVNDIAATVCSLVGVQMPNGCIGRPIEMK